MGIKSVLKDDEIPRQWFNITSDLKGVLPPLSLNGEPVKPDDLEVIFPKVLIEQEMSPDRWIDIPTDVVETLLKWRPTPLCRAEGLEKFLKSPARIYFKNESVSPTGSHKPNTAVAQAYYNKKEGVEKITTETGAGQWGSALAFACSLLDMECKVYMVRISFDQKPLRKTLMNIWGATCVASPSPETSFGRKMLDENPNSPGSLGIAVSEAIEEAVSDKSLRTKYSLGSVLNFVMLHQTVIGLEARKQLRSLGEKRVDAVIGCIGGGSNFAGIAFPFVGDKIEGQDISIIACEPESCPTLTRGPFVYDFGDSAGMTPLLAMYSLGHRFIPPAIHAGGLRYHGASPLVSKTVNEGLVHARSFRQSECFRAAEIFAKTEGIIVAPETSHAIACVIDEALKAKEEGKEKVILFCLSGHGLLDLKFYESHMSGESIDFKLDEKTLKKSLGSIKDHPKPIIAC
ncbi:TrpB-like pyridoxal phosphate-dependent enzyme [candidate division WOR-3 bacterium]|nr:TrpB-like pyridoxal phosphate-dependent enzyme [candidate division WOR-3 bacterium]